MRNQSTLPDHLEENTIKGMDIGDTGYTVPWAMFAGGDRRLWIDGNFTIDSEPGGTVCMLIKRMSDGIDVQESTIGDHKFQANGEGREGVVAPPPNAMPVSLVRHIKEKRNTLLGFLDND